MLFSYPEFTRFGCLTRDFLLLLGSRPPIGGKGPDRRVLVVHKKTGEVVKILLQKPWGALWVMAENEREFYLGTRKRLAGGAITETSTHLLRIQKGSWKVREIPAGKNTGPIPWKMLPGTGRILIPASRSVGVYRLPAEWLENPIPMAENPD
jgi:hypothetical protein